MKLKSLEQQERHKKGICVPCGGHNDRHPKWYCSTCLKHHNEYVKAYTNMRISMGICPRCGGLMKNGEKNCKPCSLIHNAKIRERRRINKEKG